jgi:hypothetical protein
MAGSNASGGGETYITEPINTRYLKTASAYRVNAYNYNSAGLADRENVYVTIFR